MLSSVSTIKNKTVCQSTDIAVTVKAFASSNGIVQRRYTVAGLGSRILLINFLALAENQGGHVNSALNICLSSKNKDSGGMLC